MRKISIIIVAIVIMFSFLAPISAVFAWDPIVPCSEPDLKGSNPANVCDWNALVKMAQNFVRYLIVLSVPLAAVLFAYAGWMLVTAGPDTGKREKAKEIFLNVGIGFLFVLTAWLIIYAITAALLDDGYSLLGGIK